MELTLVMVRANSMGAVLREVRSTCHHHHHHHGGSNNTQVFFAAEKERRSDFGSIYDGRQLITAESNRGEASGRPRPPHTQTACQPRLRECVLVTEPCEKGETSGRPTSQRLLS
jgi:hypothetical protein